MTTETKMEYVTLNNGVKMPMVFFGTFQIPPKETEKAVSEALKLGYRAIDTAQGYMNEKGVGDAVRKSGIPRDQIFLETKVWIANAGEENAEKTLLKSLERLQTDYIDLVVIHMPFGDYYGTWRAMEKLYKQGKIRAIGVSNFSLDRIHDISTYNEIKPAVNQVETHVFNQQIEMSQYLKEHNICQQAWSPLDCGKHGIFQNELLTKMAKKHNKSVAQVALRYLIQRNIVIIPKSTHIERMKENIDIFDFQLTDEEMQEIRTLDLNMTEQFDYKKPSELDRIRAMPFHN